MSPRAVIGSQANKVAFVSTLPDLSDALSQELYALIAEQPFFKGLNPQQLQLLAASALEMKFETGATIFVEGSPANRFFLILSGRVELSSEMEDRNVIPIQTLGPGDDLGWSWLFPPYLMHFSAALGVAIGQQNGQRDDTGTNAGGEHLNHGVLERVCVICTDGDGH